MPVLAKLRAVAQNTSRITCRHDNMRGISAQYETMSRKDTIGASIRCPSRVFACGWLLFVGRRDGKGQVAGGRIRMTWFI